VPTVTQVRKEPSTSGSHEHIAGVCSAAGTYYTRDQVLGGLALNEDWHTSVAGQTAKIRKIEYCPHPGCSVGPYLTTAPDHTPLTNLENLPAC
jgi:hypothetical protein